MIVRALDYLGDFTFGAGRNNYLKNKAALNQNIATRLKSFLGDCFFSTNEGIDWFNLLGAKNQLALTVAINATILNTEGVTGLIQTSFTLGTNRVMTITYKVQTIYGTAEATQQFDLAG